MIQYKPFKREINYYETDKMQVVHHSNYIRFLEECRMDFLKQLDLDYEEMEQKGILIPVLSVACDYQNPVRFGDTICIVPKLEKFSGVKFEMTYQIFSQDFKILHNKARTTHCFVDREFKPVRMKKVYPKAYESLSSLAGVDLYEV